MATDSRFHPHAVLKNDLMSAQIEEARRLNPKPCTVSIYRDGVLDRVVQRYMPLHDAMVYCETLNKINAATRAVADYQPVELDSGRNGGVR